jgi:voltage-gated potassium channel
MNLRKKLFPVPFPWSPILTITVFLSAFIIPILPENWGIIPARLGFMLIIAAGVLSIDKSKLFFLFLALGAFILEWISMIFDLSYINYISKFLNFLFFLVVVFILIRQIATSRVVTFKEILESISGYILIGIAFSIVINIILLRDPEAYNIVNDVNNAGAANTNLSSSIYYVIITMASVGYGDIVPLKPYTRSLATLIAVSGQFYIAIIISLLIGKFASKRV